MRERFAVVRPALDPDAVDMADVHRAARAASYAAGGLPEGDLDESRDPGRLAERWSWAINSPERTVRCAVERETGEIVGVLSTGPPAYGDLDPASDLQLFQIQVLPRAWGRGVGGQLHREFVHLVGEAGLRGGVLESWGGNERALAFYRHYGWRPDGHGRPGPLGIDYLRMRLRGI